MAVPDPAVQQAVLVAPGQHPEDQAKEDQPGVGDGGRLKLTGSHKQGRVP
ncbi:hypothetical protein [Limosilactobacillus fermentum]|nr:hypothetical protein [Limosilactobacillus fermentum]